MYVGWVFSRNSEVSESYIFIIFCETQSIFEESKIWKINFMGVIHEVESEVGTIYQLS